MRNALFLSVVITVMAFSASAQPYRAYSDSVINHYYQKKSWGQLYEQTHSLLDRDIDSYNVRIKAGIAAFELKKYREAVSHLEKVYAVSPGDTVMNSYYYKSLQLSGREDEAALLADRMTPALRDAVGALKEGVVHEVKVQGSLARNKDHDALTGEALASEGDIKSYRMVEKSRENYGISLGHHLFPHLNLSHAFSRMKIERTLQTNPWVNPPATQNDPSTLQYQYFLNARYTLLKGWGFNFSGSYIWGEGFDYLPLSYDMVTKKYTLGQTDLEIKDHVVSIGVNKESAWINTALSAGFGTINGYRQFQGNLNMVIYPQVNNHFFLIPDVTLHWDEEPGDYNVVFQPRIGLKTDPFWITGEYGTGDMKHFFSGGGKVVYNVPETITGYWGVVLTAPMLKDKLHLSARYRQSAKEAPLYVIANNVVTNAERFSYTDQSIMLSVEWDF